MNTTRRQMIKFMAASPALIVFPRLGHSVVTKRYQLDVDVRTGDTITLDRWTNITTFKRGRRHDM